MTSTRFWTPFAARTALAFAATSIGILTVSSSASGQTPARNKAAVADRFDAWQAGTGNPLHHFDRAASTPASSSSGWWPTTASPAQ